ncbi:MAG: hypothetical protein Q6363_004135 [Candidatus Njordarchaeota archaeon]
MFGIKLTTFQIVVIVYCVIIDLLDYVGLAIPYIGDVFDILAIALLTKAFGKDAWVSNAIQSLECLPAMDFIPFTIIAVFFIIGYKRREFLKKAKKL